MPFVSFYRLKRTDSLDKLRIVRDVLIISEDSLITGQTTLMFYFLSIITFLRLLSYLRELSLVTVFSVIFVYTLVISETTPTPFNLDILSLSIVSIYIPSN